MVQESDAYFITNNSHNNLLKIATKSLLRLITKWHTLKYRKPIICGWLSKEWYAQWLSGKAPACNSGDTGDMGCISWRKTFTPVFLPGKFHGQKSLAGYSPRGAKCWTWLSTHTCQKRILFVVLWLFYYQSFPMDHKHQS